MNGSSTNHGLMKNVYNFLIKGSRLKCSGYMIQNNADNLNHIRRQASRHFRNKKREYIKAKIHDLQTNSKNTKHQTCIGASIKLRTVTSLEYSNA